MHLYTFNTNNLLLQIPQKCYALFFINWSWRRPEIGISSIDENSITSTESFMNSRMYGNSSQENNMIRSSINQRSHRIQDSLSSMNYSGNDSSLTMATHSPPFSDLNPISLPHLGSTMPPRPVRIKMHFSQIKSLYIIQCKK